VRPLGYMLIYENVDRPGVLAGVGGVLAGAGINIAAMALGRRGKGEQALTAIDLDDEVPQEVLDHVNRVDGVQNARLIRV
ncbi:MAG: ACT domain-containing protein, partial [Rhodothermia bacterium]|nr:ACT domain-containing protein [Rhodothermia bacterium]